MKEQCTESAPLDTLQQALWRLLGGRQAVPPALLTLLVDPRPVLAWLRQQAVREIAVQWVAADAAHLEYTRCTVWHPAVGRLRGEGLAREGPQAGIAVALAALLVDRARRTGKTYLPVYDLATWARRHQRETHQKAGRERLEGDRP